MQKHGSATYSMFRENKVSKVFLISLGSNRGEIFGFKWAYEFSKLFSEKWQLLPESKMSTLQGLILADSSNSPWNVKICPNGKKPAKNFTSLSLNNKLYRQI